MTEPHLQTVLDGPSLVELEMPAPRLLVRDSLFRKWGRRVAILLGVLILIPVVLTFLYLPPFVRPVSTLMLADLVTFQGYDRKWVAYDDIAPIMRTTVVMSEDGQFCSHKGVDLGELRGVVQDAMAGEATRGASTIPMQTVKNLFLCNCRSFFRKALELPLAIYFDLIMPKKRILEIYLNIAEWGPNIYGVEAAAQHYFKTSAKNLTARQAAQLAVALPNPFTRNPGKRQPGLRRLVRVIEGRAARATGHVNCLE